MNLIPTQPKYIIPIANKLSVPEHARIFRYIQQCTPNYKIQNLAFNIYLKINLPDIPEFNKAVGSTWIASKIIIGDYTIRVASKNDSQKISQLMKLLPLDQILKIERDIVHDINFRIHY